MAYDGKLAWLSAIFMFIGIIVVLSVGFGDVGPINNSLKTLAAKIRFNVVDHEVDSADFGSRPSINSDLCTAPKNALSKAMCGYDFYEYFNGSKSNQEEESLNIAFYGGDVTNHPQRFTILTGCPFSEPNSGGCLNAPDCNFYTATTKESMIGADVVVFTASGAKSVDQLDDLAPRLKEDGTVRYRVLYIREAADIPQEIQTQFDFLMGVYWWSDIVNPIFFSRPLQLLHNGRLSQPVPSFSERPHLAMSLISNCEPTRSLRGEYIDELIKVLGPDVIHEYGKCGNRPTPKKSKFQGKIMELGLKYKFYLSFENCIQDGYVTEKLFKPLAHGVPIYLGAPDVMNVTRKKSFIRALDFKSPRELAKYMLYLANNETAYQEYHEWRNDPPELAFTDEYLNLVSRHLPHPDVFKQYRNFFPPGKKVPYLRRASCCQLCNRKFLEDTLKARAKEHFVNNRYSHSKIRHDVLLKF